MSAHYGTDRADSVLLELSPVDSASPECECEVSIVVDVTEPHYDRLSRSHDDSTAGGPSAAGTASATDLPQVAELNPFEVDSLDSVTSDSNTHNQTSDEPMPSPSPFLTAGLLSRLTWSWLGDLHALGARRPLQAWDVPALLPPEEARRNLNQLKFSLQAVEAEARSKASAAAASHPHGAYTPANTTSSPTASPIPRVTLLRRAIWRQYGFRFILSNLLLILYTGFKLLQPLMLNQMVQFVSDAEAPLWHGIIYALVLGCAAVCQAMTHHSYFFYSFRVAADARVALNALICEKALQLRTSHMLKTTTGQVVNLMSNDAAKIEALGVFTGALWNSPFECAIVLGLLWNEIGSSALAGFAVLLAMSPLQLVFSRLFARYRHYMVQRTDLRVKTINEVLSGADVLKSMHWEEALEEKVRQVRGEEFSAITRAARLKALSQAIFFGSASLINLACFGTMYLRGVTFTPANVFTTISLFSIVRTPLTTWLPMGVERLTEAKIAIQRIADFLDLDVAVAQDRARYETKLAEVETNNEQLRADADASPTAFPAGSVTMRQASFVWELSEEDAAMNASVSSPTNGFDTTFSPASPSSSRQGLRTLDVSIAPGTLIGLIGSIGSYKSSFLSACLGEMTQIGGGSLVRGILSYAPQTAWIFSDTIRANVLFGAAFEPERYARVIEACQLVDDIASCPAGDLTILGEKGVNLSGGQRARLACARAVYRRADVYLFDDPLAALDAVVARKLFDAVLGERGFLAGSTRLLVTHQTHLLARGRAHLLMLERGRLLGQGSFDDLVAASLLTEEQRQTPQGNDDAAHAHTTEEQPSADGEADASEALPQSLTLDELAQVDADDAEDNDTAQQEQRLTSADGAASTTFQRAATTVTAEIDSNGIVRAETSVVGGLGLQVFVKLFQAGGGLMIAASVGSLIVLGQVSSVLSDTWLATWSGESTEEQQESVHARLYFGLVLMTMILGTLRSSAFFTFLLRAASRLHADMFHAVVYSSMRFFEANPVGRILNRFAKDQSTIDDLLPLTFFDFVQCACMVLSALVVIGISAPYVLLILLPIMPLFVWLRHRFLLTSREVKRLESTTRSPIYALFSSTLSGLPVIRGFGNESAFLDAFMKRVDDNTRMTIIFEQASKWLGFRLDAIAAVVVLCLSLMVACSRSSMNPSDAGLALSYGLQLTALFQWAVRQSAEVETMMTSVERIVEYTELPPEGQQINPAYRPAPHWPQQGQVEFRDYKMRYREGLDLVLKGVDLVVRPGEKVGVCGRTGAGKCFGAGTRVMMHDGRTKTVEDIRDGDVLMGDDGTSRIVQHGSVHRGHTGDDAALCDVRSRFRPATYRVTLDRASGGGSWTCNGEHILVVRVDARPTIARDDATGEHVVRTWTLDKVEGRDTHTLRAHSSRFRTKKQARDHRREWHTKHDCVLVWEVPVQDFVRQPVDIQRRCVQFRPAHVDFASRPSHSLSTRLGDSMTSVGLLSLGEMPSELQVRESAWLLGFCLAVGKTLEENRSLLKRLESCLATLGESSAAIENGSNLARRVVHIARECGVAQRLLSSYGVGASSQFIPHDLLTETASIRTAFLVGILDATSSPCKDANDREVVVEEGRLAADVAFLCRSLGLRAGEISEKCHHSRTTYSIRISGQEMTSLLSSAPFGKRGVARKPVSGKSLVSALGASFTVSVVPHAEYFGFAVDGNGRFLLADFVVTHNSSLFQSLLRLVEADSGGIYIDGLEIGRLGLSDLRSNLAIIPQSPVIFSGTLRYNLDPFDTCTDAQLWSALESVQLREMVSGLRDGLQAEMAEFGGNFSVGECQLICVARALLKPSKILLIDEATANVDAKTDELIQNVIRDKFADRTVITIAHRLNTILDCEKIVVMSAGRVAEVGSPTELLARPPCNLAQQPDATYGLFSFMAAQKKEVH